MADFFGIVISIIAILFVGYCVLAIPYYYIKKIYLYLFKKSKKIKQHNKLEKFEENQSENKLDQQIEVLKKKRKKVKEDHQIEYERLGYSIQDIVNNSENYFYHFGMKFMALHILKKFKYNRTHTIGTGHKQIRQKDINDYELIQKL